MKVFRSQLETTRNRTCLTPTRRAWLGQLALGIALTFGVSNAAFAQIPRTITYQAQVLDAAGAAVSGLHRVELRVYNASGTELYSERFESVNIVGGIMNVMLGTTGPLPAVLNFNEQYTLGVSIDGGAELTPRTRMSSVPYALNADRLNGYMASTNAGPGQIPVLDAAGKLDPSILGGGGVNSINNVTPDALHNIDLVGVGNITVTTDATNNRILIAQSVASGSIREILLGPGLTGGGTPNESGQVTIQFAPGSFDGSNIANGSITGRKLAAAVAGDGLSTDPLGNLFVGVDDQTIKIVNDKLQVNRIGLAQSDGTLQPMISGSAPAGSFVRSINPDGSVVSGTVVTDASLVRTVSGNNLDIRLNTANENTFTAKQNFLVASTLRG